MRENDLSSLQSIDVALTSISTTLEKLLALFEEVAAKNKLTDEKARTRRQMIMAVKHFIQKAIEKPGALHRELGVKPGDKIPQKELKAAAKKPGKEGQRARFAETLEKMRKK